ncbi:uncharacterized WD repeat-containing protein alr2800-like [Papilio machaon]|uniref:uncharacterized WD repeat-containing protein alr2800-like n=1 Tax=Papilio machaon TaxID=76193 RepID=UPI001E664E1C|nr:uncharacterized WD repeat-containing protein alr2800-like [Papilio machaon]
MHEESVDPHVVHSLRAHRGEVACADVSGALLATGGGEGALQLWRWRRGAGWLEAAGAPRAHRFGVTAARWACSGALFASAGVDGAAGIWTRELKRRRVLAAPGATAARALCWAGTRLLVGHDDGALCVWASRRGTLLVRLKPCEGALHALAALPPAGLLLVACTTGTLKFFDLGDVYARDEVGHDPPALLWEDGAHDLGALCAASSTCGRAAASGGHDARVRLWRAGAAVGERRVRAGGVLSGHAAAVTALAWVCGTRLLVSASLDSTARLWACTTLTCLRVLHAHTRYLTCIAVSPDFRYLLTGSNDRTVRTWSTGAFGLDDDVTPSCSLLSHFGLGDLKVGAFGGENELVEGSGAGEGAGEGAGCGAEGAPPERLWVSEETHVGAINSIVIIKDVLVTACSDGGVRVYRWSARRGELVCERTLLAHRFPAAAVDLADLGAAGTLVLSAGLDGRAVLWDLQSGSELLSVSAGGAGGATGAAGAGGGVRGARLSPHRPPLLLLGMDDGALAVWTVQQSNTEPIHVYEPFAEAATCCAWSGEGRICAAGGAGGELRVLGPPPAAATLHAQRDAHDLGVLSLDFAPLQNKDESKYIMASAGRDTLVKIWEIRFEMRYGAAHVNVRLVHRVEAHGGSVECARWAAAGGAQLATCGADGWARVWRLAPGGDVRLVAAVPTGGAGAAVGATAAAMLGPTLLAVGSLTGELAVWRVPAPLADVDEDDEPEPRMWGPTGVARWLRDYVTRVPEDSVSEQGSGATSGEARLSGARLLQEPLPDLMPELLRLLRRLPSDEQCHIRKNNNLRTKLKEEANLDNERLLKRLEEEIEWLRREAPAPELEACAPHTLRCPLTHALFREPVRAADGFTYERANILDYFFVNEAAVSPLTGRRLRSAHLSPNLVLRQQLRDFLCKSTAPDASGSDLSRPAPN